MKIPYLPAVSNFEPMGTMDLAMDVRDDKIQAKILGDNQTELTSIVGMKSTPMLALIQNEQDEKTMLK